MVFTPSRGYKCIKRYTQGPSRVRRRRRVQRYIIKSKFAPRTQTACPFVWCIITFPKKSCTGRRRHRDVCHQVKVTPEDQAAFRFVYRTPNSRLAPLTYQMNVHVFGAVSSPTSCIFALKKTADDNRKSFPEAAASVRRRSTTILIRSTVRRKS